MVGRSQVIYEFKANIYRAVGHTCMLKWISPLLCYNFNYNGILINQISNLLILVKIDNLYVHVYDFHVYTLVYQLLTIYIFNLLFSIYIYIYVSNNILHFYNILLLLIKQ